MPKNSRLSRREFVGGLGATLVLPSQAANAASKQLHRVDAGTGDPAFVFIHGVTCSSADWRHQVAALSGRNRCIAVDLPGHGQSAAGASPRIDDMAVAVNETLDSLGIGAAVLAGHSMGCRVASAAHEQKPQRTRGLVYVDGSLLGGDPEVAVRRAEQMLNQPDGMQGFIDRLYEDFFVGTSPQAVRQVVNARRKDIDPDFLRALFLDFVRWDATNGRRVLSKLNVPVLVIQSTAIGPDMRRAPIRSGQVTPWMQAIAELVPKARIETVPNVGHFTMLEAPSQTNDLIRSFVASLG